MTPKFPTNFTFPANSIVTTGGKHSTSKAKSPATVSQSREKFFAKKITTAKNAQLIAFQTDQTDLDILNVTKKRAKKFVTMAGPAQWATALNAPHVSYTQKR
jgi:hypothetical protein